MEADQHSFDRAFPWPVHPWVTAGQRRIRFGIAYGPFGEWPAGRDWVQLIEELGYDSYWVPDHPIRNADGWTSLAALAGATRRLRLGILTSAVTYRPPVLLARLMADIDRLSQGRLVVGLGIGDYEREFAQLGLRHPSTRIRQEMLEEAVTIVRGVTGQQPFSFDGRHYRVEQAELRPGPVQSPRVPFLIAGGGERVTLRQVAQYADMANFAAHAWAGSAFGLEDVQRKYAALGRHCAALGRPFETIIRSHLALPLVLAETPAAVAAKLERLPTHLLDFWRSSLVAGTPEEVTAHYRALIGVGVQYFIGGFLRGPLERDEESVRLLAERVAPVIRDEANDRT